MARAGEQIYEWDKQPRMPLPAPPRKSCDCQFHIYEGLEKFPPRPNPPYPPIESATFTEAQRVHRAIRFDRGVIVHSAIYGSDHRLLLDALQSLDDRDRYRGIGIGRTLNGQSA
jgi:2-pyrone-4,6-dicarboxylate lactonase